MNKQQIKELRFMLDMTQEQFAEKIGASVPTVRGWEAGKNPPNERFDFKLRKLKNEIKY